MDSKAILVLYDKVSALTGLMVQAAEKGDWDALAELELQSSPYLDTLQVNDHNNDLTDDEIEHKMQLIQKILDDNQHIRELTESGMKELSSMINSSEKARQVNRAYSLN